MPLYKYIGKKLNRAIKRQAHPDSYTWKDISGLSINIKMRVNLINQKHENIRHGCFNMQKYVNSEKYNNKNI